MVGNWYYRAKLPSKKGGLDPPLTSQILITNAPSRAQIPSCQKRYAQVPGSTKVTWLSYGMGCHFNSACPSFGKQTHQTVLSLDGFLSPSIKAQKLLKKEFIKSGQTKQNPRKTAEEMPPRVPQDFKGREKQSKWNHKQDEKHQQRNAWQLETEIATYSQMPKQNFAALTQPRYTFTWKQTAIRYAVWIRFGITKGFSADTSWKNIWHWLQFTLELHRRFEPNFNQFETYLPPMLSVANLRSVIPNTSSRIPRRALQPFASMMDSTFFPNSVCLGF